jgi:hypothetical protein
MSLHSRRVRKITLALTPQQGAINHVANVRQHTSFDDYSRFFLDRWEEPSFEELCAQVVDSVEVAMPAAEDGEVARAVRAAVRETAFLCFLHQYVTALVTQEERILALMSLLADEMLGRVLSTPGNPAVGSHDELVLKTRAVDFVQTARGLALHVYALSAAVRSIEGSYFKGTGVLFESSAATMREIMEHLESTAAYNALVAERHTWVNTALDLQNLRAVSCDRARSISADLVGMAEVDALRYIGDQEGAREIMRRLAERMANSRGGATNDSNLTPGEPNP